MSDEYEEEPWIPYSYVTGNKYYHDIGIKRKDDRIEIGLIGGEGTSLPINKAFDLAIGILCLIKPL